MAIAPFRPAAAGAYLSAVPLTPTLAAAEQRADGQTIHFQKYAASPGNILAIVTRKV